MIGSVGAGKTCFLYSLLNEIEKTSGDLTIGGKISYSPQEAWCFGGSIRDNILLGEKMDQSKYAEVIKVCGLERDLQIFPSGDRTFVGEKGYTLSGGQKARVTLARAVYRDADIYLLDDPLSAVDPQVANHIFEKCIRGYLKNKTVVLVTHQLQFLSKADKILVLDAEDENVFGDYDEIKRTGHLDEVIETIKSSKENSPAKDNPNVNRSISKSSVTQERSRNTSSVGRNGSISESMCGDDKLKEKSQETFGTGELGAEGQEDREETMAIGSVGSKVYWEYFRSGASIYFLFFVLLITAASQTVYNYTDYWLSEWTENYAPINGTLAPVATVESERNNLLIYTGIMIALFATYMGRVISCYFLCLNCSIELHNRIFQAVVIAKMSFFENNPIGECHVVSCLIIK